MVNQSRHEQAWLVHGLMRQGASPRRWLRSKKRLDARALHSLNPLQFDNRGEDKVSNAAAPRAASDASDALNGWRYAGKGRGPLWNGRSLRWAKDVVLH